MAQPRIRITIDLIDEHDEIIDGSQVIAGAVELHETSTINTSQWVMESIMSVKMAHVFKGE